ncbi:MAG: cyclic nucleotide-binding domain-containing protein [Treponema sp.]|jgi:CRP-like cAMP-binding protein|nr:cyclic nucleotide-binding domain-containing protein [Treponema sp.]
MAGQLQLKFVNFSKGAYIIVEGKHDADRFFIIRDGKVRITKETEVVEEERGNLLGPGDFFGVISTMSSHSHIETARALTGVSLISVQKDQYPQLIQQNAPVAMKIILQFSRRMRYLDEALTKLTLRQNSETDASRFFTIGEYYAKKNQYLQAFYAYNQYIKYNPGGPNVVTARMRMMKIAPYAKGVRLSFDEHEVLRNYVKDSMIFSEGEWGDELFIIQKGSVKITKIVDNNEVLLAVLKIGDIFGEMALLESKPRAASAVAYEDCTVTTVNRANFEQMIAREPQIIARLTTLLSERIWSIYRQLANTLIDNPLGRMYDALFIQLEKNRIPSKYSGSFYFDIGPDELANMVGISQAESKPILKKLLENRIFKIVNNKIYVNNSSEIFRQSEYYKKIMHRDRSIGRNTGY